MRDEAAISRGIIKKSSISALGSGRVVKPEELLAFVQQFAGMTEAGIPIIQCLEALAKQAENIKFRKIIRNLVISIKGGSTFSSALMKYPNVFSPFFVNMIRAGEKGGILDKILNSLALQIEKMQDIKRKVRGAFAYPVIVGALAILVITFLLVFIIPVFQGVFEKLDITLPLPTRMLIFLSEFLRKFGWILFLLSVGAGFLFYRLKDTDIIKKRVDRIKVNMPVFGKINRKAAVSRFVRTLGIMMESGVMITEAINTAKDVAGNVVISEVVDRILNNIREGKKISDALEDQELIPAAVVQMISVGESSATLPKMLGKSAEALERDLDLTIKRIIVVVEPALTLIMACVVAFIALSVYLPIFEIVNQIQNR